MQHRDNVSMSNAWWSRTIEERIYHSITAEILCLPIRVANRRTDSHQQALTAPQASQECNLHLCASSHRRSCRSKGHQERLTKAHMSHLSSALQGRTKAMYFQVVIQALIWAHWTIGRSSRTIMEWGEEPFNLIRRRSQLLLGLDQICNLMRSKLSRSSSATRLLIPSLFQQLWALTHSLVDQLQESLKPWISLIIAMASSRRAPSSSIPLSRPSSTVPQPKT